MVCPGSNCVSGLVKYTGRMVCAERVKHQPHKMVRHTQTIRRQIFDKLSVFDHFVELALKGLNT